MDADVKTGMRPISRRQFRKGGKVVAVHGKHAVHHAGKKPRKSGGRAKDRKTNIVISINAQPKDQQQPMMPKMPTPSPLPETPPYGRGREVHAWQTPPGVVARRLLTLVR